ncbi:alpha/beta fold hydrolase [Acinetobacter bereziniae]|uniref:alpha/beta hydrolase family protein n=1 Tax=Acinetobacter bereziniae TaxID=106648 RepID=UPI000C2C9818|nr:alpha/beta fold hydrolase [Acinetobacter bereziniae]ATZ62699.1 alpha/beta hydrolase [Acinetobacter bereziniae]
MPNINHLAQIQPSKENGFKCESVTFQALDGYTLVGTRYTPTTHPFKANLLVSSATGVPQAFYRRFSEYASQMGYQVLCFDYRGVDKSAPRQLKGFKMSYLDWGKLDLAGAIDYFFEDDTALFLVGHSYGGQALGLTPNHDKVTAMYCFGTGAGWHGYMPLKEKLKVQVIWNIVFPPMVAITGYLPWSKLNMGADLPKGVYQQWRKWCKNPTYFFADPGQQTLHDQYAQVKTPIYAVAALDDDWALPNSRYAFMQHYKNAPMHFINISAEDFGLQQIGHMGYFRKGLEQIWDKMLATFESLIPPCS